MSAATNGRGRSRAAEVEQIAAWLRTFAVEPGQVFELRVLDYPRKRATTAGYYDDLDAMADAAARYSGKGGVYFTLNPVEPALLGRYCNRCEEWAEATTPDNHILRRCWLFIDFDPKRPARVSATDPEKELAHRRAQDSYAWLKAAGWPDAVCCDSGNGWHLLYRIDLPNDDDARQLVERCLKALSFRFSDAAVEVDETTFNAARICKLYGTLAAKGDDMTGKTRTPREARPHRLARVVSVPESLQVVSREQLERLAGQLPGPEPEAQRGGRGFVGRAAGAFDVAAWIGQHNLPVVRDGPWGDGGHRWILNPCPWNAEHTDAAAYVVRFKSGAVAAGCHHNAATRPWWRCPPWPSPRERSATAGRSA
jgi:hypothetical protein